MDLTDIGSTGGEPEPHISEAFLPRYIPNLRKEKPWELEKKLIFILAISERLRFTRKRLSDPPMADTIVFPSYTSIYSLCSLLPKVSQ